MKDQLEAHVFELDSPWLEQTHGRLMDEYKHPAGGLVKVVVEFGTLDGEGEFILHTGVTPQPVALTGLELSLFLDEPIKKGAKKRGQYRDEDLAEWIKVGKDARAALVAAEHLRLNPPPPVEEEEEE